MTRRVIALLMILVILLIGSIAIVGSFDSHHVNLKYLLWKYDLGSDYRHGMRYFNVDASFRQTFEGQPREQLLRFFPVLVPKSEAATHLRIYDRLLQDKDGEWIGESNWFVWYKRDVVHEILLVKG